MPSRRSRAGRAGPEQRAPGRLGAGTLQQHRHGRLGHRPQVDGDGRQRRVGRRREDVVAADDRDVPGHLHAERGQPTHHAVGEDVVEGHHGGGPGGPHPVGQRIPVLVGAVSGGEAGELEAQLRRLVVHRGAALGVRPRAWLRAGEVRQPTVPELGQPGDGLAHRRTGVEEHPSGVVDVAVDQDEAVLLREATERGRRQPRGAQEQAFDLVGQQGDRRLLPAGLLVGVGEQDVEPTLLREVLHVADQRREEGVGDVGDDDPHGARPSGRQRPGVPVGTVPRCPSRLQNALDGLGPKQLRAREGSRHRRRRHAELCGQQGDGRSRAARTSAPASSSTHGVDTSPPATSSRRSALPRANGAGIP